jgi:CRISPR-associated protein Cmr3
MRLLLSAVDVWLFRDGRLFDAGSDHRAESLFPPYPSVVQGAIRSHHLVVKGVDLRNGAAIADAVGTATDYKGLRVRGPFVAKCEGGRARRYLPQPADAVTIDPDAHTLRAASVPRPPGDAVLTSAPTPLLLGLDDEPAKGEGGLWLREDRVLEYLGGENGRAVVEGTPARELFEHESRVGIGRDDKRRTTREGALYEVDFIRPVGDVGLLVEVEGYDGWPQSGMLRLGGEGRAARFERVEADPWPVPPDPLPERFKLYLATSAYFGGGWRPRSWSGWFEGEVELQAAAVARYESVGGYDLAAGGNRGHKPAQRYVPAGSVYYFACRGPARFRPDLVQGAVTEYGAEIGYGQVLVERW